MKILIIGGAGEFGVFYAKLLKKAGFDIWLNDKNNSLCEQTCEINGFGFVKNLSPKGFDIVIISVPNNYAPKIIGEIIPLLDEKTLLLDFCSVKTQVVSVLEKFKEKNLELVSVHPMHGPRVKDLQNVPIVFIPIKISLKMENT